MLREKATYFLKYFTQDNPRKVWAFTDDTPEELIAIVRDGVHQKMFPDDIKFEMVVDCLNDIADGRSDYGTEPPIYTMDLLRWLSSNLNRIGYCDEFLEQHKATNLEAIISGGWILEYEEVLSIMENFLDNWELEEGVSNG